jgi:hypothetical protein
MWSTTQLGHTTYVTSNLKEYLLQKSTGYLLFGSDSHIPGIVYFHNSDGLGSHIIFLSGQGMHTTIPVICTILGTVHCRQSQLCILQMRITSASNKSHCQFIYFFQQEVLVPTMMDIIYHFLVMTVKNNDIMVGMVPIIYSTHCLLQEDCMTDIIF